MVDLDVVTLAGICIRSVVMILPVMVMVPEMVGVVVLISWWR